MKLRYKILMFFTYSIITILILNFNQDCNELTDLSILIYYIIGLLFWFLGEYCGETELIERQKLNKNYDTEGYSRCYP